MLAVPPRRHRYVDLGDFKPVIRAYALGYASSTVPRLVGFLRMLRRKDKTTQEKIDLLSYILRTSMQFNRFPTSCAVIVGGATLFPRLLGLLLKFIYHVIGSKASILRSATSATRLRFVCTFLSAWYAFDLLNRDSGWTRKRAMSGSSTFFHKYKAPPNQHHLPENSPQFAGKTIDFTLFALTRALDVLAITLWTATRHRPWHPEHHHPHLARLLRHAADPTIFAFSAAIIMWSWFYSPTRLPAAYNRWISTAAAIDPRLISALRLARQGDFIYGQDTGQASLLAGLCDDLGVPREWGDPARTIPVPCNLVHMGTGRSCEYHALSRFLRTFAFAFQMYLPLQVLLLLRIHPRKIALRHIIALLKSSTRSSAFLGAFVALFYYGVCLSRSRLSHLIPTPTVTPQMWDSGLCILGGCMACGSSILLETPARRQEIAFFVVPRALATLGPRVYDRRWRWREQVLFAGSVAAVVASVGGGRGKRVRGVLGRVLEGVLRE